MVDGTRSTRTRRRMAMYSVQHKIPRTSGMLRSALILLSQCGRALPRFALLLSVGL